MKSVLVQGTRICDIVPVGSEFPVASPLEWHPAPDDVDPDTHTFDCTAVVPLPAKPLAQIQAAKIAALNASCAAAITAGFTSSALGAPYTYGSTVTDQSNLAANVLSSLLPNLAAGWTTPQLCADAGGAWAYRPHTAAQIQQVGADAKAAILAQLVKKATLEAQVNAALDAVTVNAIVW